MIGATGCKYRAGFAMGSFEAKVRWIGCAATAAALLSCPEASHAYQSGASFWLPGQYASFAAMQQTPGWSLGVSYFHSSVAVAGSVAAARQILVGRIPSTVKVDLNLSLSGRSDLVTLTPSYTFATPVLGGQLLVALSSSSVPCFQRGAEPMGSSQHPTSAPRQARSAGAKGSATWTWRATADSPSRTSS